MLEKWLHRDVEPEATRDNKTESCTTLTPVCDWSEFVKRALGDLKISRGVVTLFIDNGQEYIESIRSALTLEDAAALRLSAHKLKGAAATMELPQLAQTASLIEVLAEEGDLEKAVKLFPVLEKKYKEALEALQEHLDNPPGE
jgi:HPt (histidine-containing phosphotransfer) domain-containing protein